MALKIYHLGTNYLTNPIGIDHQPFFSWKRFSKKRNHNQVMYRICVSSEYSTQSIPNIWDSGYVLSDDCVNIPYEGQTLHPRSRYYWWVTIIDNYNEETLSDIAFFETGKYNEVWVGNFITAPFIKGIPASYSAPYIKQNFTLTSSIKNARLYVCGVGYFEGYLNGSKIGDDLLSPPYTNYDKTLLYMTYDVTSLLHKENNTIGFLLGNGFYNCFTEDPWSTPTASWRDSPKIIAELHVQLDSDEHFVLSTDSKWLCAKSPITYNSIRNGEYYDSRLELSSWCSSTDLDHHFEPVIISRPPGGTLTACEIQPIKSTLQLHAKKWWKDSNNIWTFDFGQNIAGIVSLNIEGNKNTEWIIRYGEKLREDNALDTEHNSQFIRSGEFQTDKYIKKSDKTEHWQPHFVYHGFRYIQIEGLDYEPNITTAIAHFIHTDLPTTAHFNCSNKMLNQLQKNVYWSSLSNIHGIPTDCPHREKNAWTGDACLSSEQMLLNHLSAPLFKKWLNDVTDAQRPSGTLPCIIPTPGWGYHWGNGPDYSAGALTLIPWYIYQYYNDINIIKKMYPAIVKQFTYMLSMANQLIVDYGIGDWCPPFTGKAITTTMSSFKSPVALTDTAYFYNTAKKLSLFAHLLGQSEDEIYFSHFANDIRAAFRSRFITDEIYNVNTTCQTSLATILYHGLANENEEKRLYSTLVKIIHKNNNFIDYGILGSKFMPNVLGQHGDIDLFIEMLTKKEFPGLGYQLEQGATTLWECYNGEGSRNHHMNSEFSLFFYKYLVGIQICDQQPGFKHTLFKPALDSQLTYANGDIDSIYGNIRCHWAKSNNKITIKLQIPPSCSGTLYLPAKFSNSLYENQNKINTQQFENKACITLASGNYNFDIMP